MKYTVVAIYSDNGQLWVDVVSSLTPAGARSCAPANTVVVAVFEGDHKSLADDADENGILEAFA